jgi:hypothetical protein
MDFVSAFVDNYSGTALTLPTWGVGLRSNGVVVVTSGAVVSFSVIVGCSAGAPRE